MSSFQPEPSKLEQLVAAHARLKRRIHAFRMPIRSKLGIFGMGCFYFSIPVVSGYYIMQWSNGLRESNLGTDRERLLEAKRRWEEQASGNDRPKVVMARTPEPKRVITPPAKVL